MATVSVVASLGVAAASGVLKTVLTKCGDALSNTDSAAGLNSALFGDLQPKLKELKEDLGKWDDLLDRLNPAQHTDNRRLSPWLERVKEAVIFADNLLEDISYYHLRRQVEGGSKVGQIFRASDGTSIKFRHKIGSRLNKFKAMAAHIYKEAGEIKLLQEAEASNSSIHPPATTSTSNVVREMRMNPVAVSDIFVGRQAEEDFIVSKLCPPHINNDQPLQVVVIFGMSGVGKTLLARKIFHDNKTVEENYTQKVWISASQDFKLTRILKEMLEYHLPMESHGMTNTDAMEKKIRECLKRESYLLILDDVWDLDKRVWDSIRKSLERATADCTSRKVLVTTQSRNVASVMGAESLTREIEALSNEDSLTLFEGIAFATRSQPTSELREIGKRIMNKCGGLPLAITTLASLLASKNERSQWESVEKDPVWKLSEGQNTIMPWLLISFNHLPNPVVKKCFAHWSVMIPKGVYIIEEWLTEYWIAQGFIQPSKTSDDSDMVKTAREFIKSMRDHNLLQANERTEPIEFGMHDLIYDLALYVSMKSSLIVRGDSKDLSKASSGVEHACLYGNTCKSSDEFPKGNTQSTLRTLISIQATISMDLVAQARFLRQLHLQLCGLEEIPSSIGMLKHLRILDLSGNPFEYLPEAIGTLYNLRILSLDHCSRLVELPQQVTKLLNLRLIHTTEAVHVPKGMGQLTRLRRLPLIKLKAEGGMEIAELRSLQHLRGVVSITQLENVSSKEGVMDADLKSKEGITDLELIWKGEGHQDEVVMEGLQPHSNLEDLWVENFHGNRFSPWLSGGFCLNRLTCLTLRNCQRCEQLPTLGCLPCLKSLLIDTMESVKVIGNEFYACSKTGSIHSDTSQRNQLFPRLEEFQLLNMLKLKEWVDPLGVCASTFPCLRELSIKNCPSLVTVPTCFHSLLQLSIKGIDSYEPLLMILESNGYKLTSLEVQNVQQLTCFSEPLLKCTNLQLLKIKDCKELVELPPTLLRSLGCLETFEVCGCHSMTSFPSVEGLLFP